MDTGDVDVTTRGDVDKLKGNAVGLYSILFLCVTGSAPLAVFIYNTPFTMPYGSGSSGPGDVPLRHDRAHDLLDRVRRDGQEGARRGRHVHVRQPRPRAGLGRDGRLLADDRLRDLRRRPARRLLVVRCRRSSCSTTCHVNWLWLALIGVVLVVCLAYFDVEISAKVLGVALISEIMIIAIASIAFFWHTHRTSRSRRSCPGTASRPGVAPGVGVFFAFWSWVGFEAAPNYAEEAKDPVRVIPIALIFSCVAVGPALHVHVVGARLGLRHGHRTGRRSPTPATPS